ncbi:MAG: right-handed parallel beta-helix repeat-containing protein [bacterium]
MKKQRFIVVLCLCMIFLIGVCVTSNFAQTTKWVDQAGGSDANDGNTEATAYATLQFAIDNSTSGTATTQSVINVKDGTYRITGQSNRIGFATAILIKDLDYLTVQAVSGHNPKVKPVTSVEANIVSISVDNCDHLIVDNIDSDQTVAQFDNWHVFDSDDLTLKNSTFEGGEDGIDFNTDMTTAMIENNHFKDVNTGNGDEVLDFTDASYSDVTIQDNTFENNYRQITLNKQSGKTISDFTIRRNIMNGTNSQEAVRLIGASNILIENNVIMNNMQQGVYIDNGCATITIRHNSFFNNDQEFGGNGEVRTKVTSADIVIKNNIFYANGSNPVFETTVTSLPGEDYNLVYNFSGSFTYGANTITGSDPLFVNTTPGSEDLHLQTTSPAIAAGTDLGVSDDLEKNSRPRPAPTNPDMGAYESSEPAPSGPRNTKEDVIADLSSLLPTGDKKTDKCIKKAIKNLKASLVGKYWQDDSHLTKKGGKVFKKEKSAVKYLMKIDDPPAAVTDAIDALVETDRTLAQTAIDEAVAASANPKKIADAEKEMDKAQNEIDADKFDKGIDRFRRAWQYAFTALKDALPKSTADAEVFQSELNIPVDFTLKQNYPNPFNPSTTITFALPEAGEVTLAIYNLRGQLIRTLASSVFTAGVHNLAWDGKDASGLRVASGIYVFRIQANDFVAHKKLLLTK